MKTALISVLTAILLGFASLASGRPFDAADFTSLLFATGLVAWTVNQYSRTPRKLILSRTIRLSAVDRIPAVRGANRRLAA